MKRNIRCNTLLSVADIDRISNCSKHKAIFEMPVVDKKGISSYYQMKVTKCVTYDNPFQPITAIIGHLKVYNKNHILMEDRGVECWQYPDYIFVTCFYEHKNNNIIINFINTIINIIKKWRQINLR